jgi:hypothetical protein
MYIFYILSRSFFHNSPCFSFFFIKSITIHKSEISHICCKKIYIFFIQHLKKWSRVDRYQRHETSSSYMLLLFHNFPSLYFLKNRQKNEFYMNYDISLCKRVYVRWGDEDGFYRAVFFSIRHPCLHAELT